MALTLADAISKFGKSTYPLSSLYSMLMICLSTAQAFAKAASANEP